ncbi:hypothetical protein HK096_004238 [Nowakowskiella sp. JEL0078]|nr:hypothetical protein HK096_004238 [Nowakowskiella sp. JEL0078]
MQTQTLTMLPQCLQNWISNEHIASLATLNWPDESENSVPVVSPASGSVIAFVPVSTAEDVHLAVEAAKTAGVAWAARTYKDRATVLLKAYNLLQAHSEELADLIVLEHGKNKLEAGQEISKGLETLEYALGMPILAAGRVEEVSRGVECKDVRRPVGVVASIVPFNFPFMVPFWTLPLILATGNTLVLKPSEKVPLTMARTVEILKESGLPSGVVNLVHGTVATVNALCDHPDIKVVTFVGSTKVAELVYKRAISNNKRALCLGGAKNHLVASPDCNIEMTAQDVVNSFTGCTGQRCMAASVLLTISQQSSLIDTILTKTKSIVFGQESGQLGPVIDDAAVSRINGYIAQAEKSGAKILLDGRKVSNNGTAFKGGYWVGPTVILHKSSDDAAMKEEIFGPLLSIYVCKDAEEALKIENRNPYGNAACIYTTRGDIAEYFTKRFSAGMIGVNVGVPVPREPFSFGGINASKFGTYDITGDGGVRFCIHISNAMF